MAGWRQGDTLREFTHEVNHSQRQPAPLCVCDCTQKRRERRRGGRGRGRRGRRSRQRSRQSRDGRRRRSRRVQCGRHRRGLHGGRHNWLLLTCGRHETRLLGWAQTALAFVVAIDSQTRRTPAESDSGQRNASNVSSLDLSSKQTRFFATHLSQHPRPHRGGILRPRSSVHSTVLSEADEPPLEPHSSHAISVGINTNRCAARLCGSPNNTGRVASARVRRQTNGPELRCLLSAPREPR
jgi:hypothetical protein